jgi:hypothetical protein
MLRDSLHIILKESVEFTQWRHSGEDSYRASTAWQQCVLRQVGTNISEAYSASIGLQYCILPQIGMNISGAYSASIGLQYCVLPQIGMNISGAYSASIGLQYCVFPRTYRTMSMGLRQQVEHYCNAAKSVQNTEDDNKSTMVRRQPDPARGLKYYLHHRSHPGEK